MLKRIFFVLLLTAFALCVCACGDNSTDIPTEYVCTHENITKDTVSPTCDGEGYTKNKCPDCGIEFITDTLPSLGHTFEKKTVPPSCNTLGYTTYTCDCGYSYQSDTVAPTGHDYTAVVTPPTCTDGGYTTYTCACGSTYTGNFVTPLGHTFEKAGKEPTCTESGYTTYTCGCGYSYTVDFVPPLSHDFKLTSKVFPTVVSTGFSTYTCLTCNYSYNGSYMFYNQVTDGAYAGNTEIVHKGIDVSAAQHKVYGSNTYSDLDWEAIKESGVEFVILRAGTTKSGKDPVFEKNYAGAKAAGLYVGAYYYSYATTVAEAEADAYKLISYIDGKQFEYPIYFDLEDPTQENLSRELLTEITFSFFKIVQSEGYYTSLYINHKWLTQILDKNFILDTFDIWYARWPGEYENIDVSRGELPIWNTESYGENLGMWQFSSTGTVAGIPDKPVDISVSYKNYPEIIKSLGLNGYGEKIEEKTYIWVIANSLNVRSSPDFEANNIIGQLIYGQKVEVIEKTDKYTKILYEGQPAYITANTNYISDTNPIT